MRAAGLEGRRKKRWRTTTIADPAAQRARDLIRRDFAPRPGTDRRYVGDITYIATWEGWAYLATVIDLASRRVVGWALADHMRTEPRRGRAVDGVHRRRPAAGVIFHSDRGCQYTSGDFAALASGKRRRPVGVQERRMLGQRRRRELLRHHQARAHRRPRLAYPRRPAPGRLRLHRGLVQHPPAAFQLWATSAPPNTRAIHHNASQQAA